MMTRSGHLEQQTSGMYYAMYFKSMINQIQKDREKDRENFSVRSHLNKKGVEGLLDGVRTRAARLACA